MFFVEKEGIQIHLKKGDTELKITMGSDVSRSKIRAVKDMLGPFTPTSNTQSQDKQKNSQRNGEVRRRNKTSLFYRLKVLVANVFRYGQIFTSKDVREAFQEIFGEKLNPSTCSTYLRRMEQDGLLTSKKGNRIIEYRLTNTEIDLPSLDELERQQKEDKKEIVVPTGN